MSALEDAVRAARDASTTIFDKDAEGSDHLVAVQIPIDDWLHVLGALFPDYVTGAAR